MRVLVCGGRDFADKNLNEYRFVHLVLNILCDLASNEYNPFDNWLPTDIVIIEGGARGADRAASDYAVVNFCQHLQFPADWATHGKRAGYIRNKQMLDEGKPDLVIAFPGGKGTAMMVDIAIKAGVKVVDLGGLNPMTMTYNKSELKTMLGEAILSGDKERYEAVTNALAEEYEETIKGQEIIDGIDMQK